MARQRINLVLAAVVSMTVAASAGEADVEAVKATRAADGTWRFDVTVRHADTGWDHYANRWDVVAPDGTILGTRRLLHPHENEQPFTRSLSGVSIPDGVTSVTIRANDSVHGEGGREFTVEVLQ
jgi:hypothetical protein